MSFTQLWLKSWIIKCLHANICASMFMNKVHIILIIYNFGSHAFYFLVVAKWFSSIVVVHITAMFNVHIRIGHRWNKGQRVLLPQNSVFVLQSRVCENMSCEESKHVGSHAFYFLVIAKWFSSIVVVHITAMFNVHICIGHRWNKGQSFLASFCTPK